MFAYKNNLILCAIFITISALTSFMTIEYIMFSNQVRQLKLLQEQYRNCLEMVREIAQRQNEVDDYNRQERIAFPQGTYVFSSHNADQPNLFINRQDNYLKESTFTYFKERQLDSLLKKLKTEYYLEDVEDIVVAPSLLPKKKSIMPVMRTRRSFVHPPELALMWPIDKSQFWLSSLFGSRKNPDGSLGFHRGVDMASAKGTAVRAAATGKVVEARYVAGYGNTVVVKHTNKYKTRYAHLATITVSVGQYIKRGTLVGTVGDTGWVRKAGSDASHLHFELHAYGKQVNPLPFLRSVG